MATIQIAAPARAHSPLALWHLLSLDAPTVAVLWTWFTARTCGVPLPAASLAAMALAVWILYAADRLLDARLAHDSAELEARHRFHHLHRRVFFAGIALSSLLLGALLPLLGFAALRLYLVEGMLLVAWFVILHATRNAHRLPKEIAVGIFFSAAVFIPTVARRPALRPQLAPAALLLAALCALNCLFIYCWEHAAPLSNQRKPHPTTRHALRHLGAAAVIVAASGTALLLFRATPGPLAASCVLSTAALFTLHRSRFRLSRTHLRAAADLALLTPLLFLPLQAHLSR